MLENYYFDLPLYARLKSPVGVVMDWRNPEVRGRDTWRDELADAGDFAPLRARAGLLQPDRLVPALCSRAVSWVVGPSSLAGPAMPVLTAAAAVSTWRGTTLWRFDPAALEAINVCMQTPLTD